MTRNLLTIAIALCCCSFAFADDITLKSSVRLRAGASTIRLADIAHLEGEAALALAQLPIAESAPDAAVHEIPLATVREKLENAGVHWGIVNLSGKSVIVRSARPADASPPLAMTPVEIAPAAALEPQRQSARDEFLASSIASQPTLRGAIVNLIVSNLQIQPSDLRIAFDRTDAELLKTSVQAARFELQPLGSFNSDRIDFAVRTWVDGQVQRSQYVSAFPTLRTSGATLRSDIRAGHTLVQDDLAPAELWLPPAQATMTANAVSAVGRVAVTNMKQGEVLRDKNIRRDAVIKRGELVIVRCLVGGVVISLQAEARADGAQGDIIEFRKQGERETFLATVSKRGEAVLNLSQRS